jgi:hypothetical protein
MKESTLKDNKRQITRVLVTHDCFSVFAALTHMPKGKRDEIMPGKNGYLGDEQRHFDLALTISEFSIEREFV